MNALEIANGRKRSGGMMELCMNERDGKREILVAHFERGNLSLQRVEVLKTVIGSNRTLLKTSKQDLN